MKILQSQFGGKANNAANKAMVEIAGFKNPILYHSLFLAKKSLVGFYKYVKTGAII